VNTEHRLGVDESDKLAGISASEKTPVFQLLKSGIHIKHTRLTCHQALVLTIGVGVLPGK